MPELFIAQNKSPNVRICITVNNINDYLGIIYDKSKGYGAVQKPNDKNKHCFELFLPDGKYQIDVDCYSNNQPSDIEICVEDLTTGHTYCQTAGSNTYTQYIAECPFNVGAEA